MRKLLQSAAVGLVLTALAAVVPASAGGYDNGPREYGYAPGPEFIGEPEDGTVVYSYSEVRIRTRGSPSHDYGYGPAYLPDAPDGWRQRNVAFDTVITREKRIIYDSRAAAEFYAPKVHAYGPPAYYRGPAYGSIKDYGPAPVRIVEPIIDPAGNCGRFKYRNGDGCFDARNYPRYRNPHRGRYLPRW